MRTETSSYGTIVTRRKLRPAVPDRARVLVLRSVCSTSSTRLRASAASGARASRMISLVFAGLRPAASITRIPPSAALAATAMPSAARRALLVHRDVDTSADAGRTRRRLCATAASGCCPCRRVRCLFGATACFRRRGPRRVVFVSAVPARRLARWRMTAKCSTAVFGSRANAAGTSIVPTALPDLSSSGNFRLRPSFRLRLHG